MASCIPKMDLDPCLGKLALSTPAEDGCAGYLPPEGHFPSQTHLASCTRAGPMHSPILQKDTGGDTHIQKCAYRWLASLK
jgi:hypothetical protein